MSTYYGPAWPAAASAEAAAVTARRHQPETEGARADLDMEAGQ